MFKAIETVYNGYRFRSRHEARWAVFFDKLKIRYRYEFEGFDLDGLRYLPDFYLPKQQCWIEIKPDLPTKKEREKAIRLCIGKKETVFILAGEVGKDVICYCFDTHFSRRTKDEVVKFFEEHKYKAHWLSTVECIAQDNQGNFLGLDLELGFRWSSAYWGECSQCKALGLVSQVARKSFVHENNLCKCKIFNPTQRIEEALLTGRQAQF